MTEGEAMRLMGAWLERKKWQAKLDAVTLLNELNTALGGDKQSTGQMSDAALRALGFKVE